MDLDKITIKDLLDEPEITAIGLAGRKMKEIIDEFNEYADEQNIDRKYVKEFLESRTVLEFFIKNRENVANQIISDKKLSKNTYSLDFQIKALKNAKNHREYLKNNYIHLNTKELRNEYNLDIQEAILDAFYNKMEEICE